ncbi:MAG TPA: ABC transporter permease [Candidatus Microsaccharimonas sp.]|nr:ABC transporter permease [Candidatus Microsaccharimonas sp.]
MTFGQKLYTVWAFFTVNLKRLFRDKTALFFTFLFPLIFLLVFGYANKNSGVSFSVAVINESSSQTAVQTTKDIKAMKVFKVDKTVTTMDQAREKMKRSQLDATIVLPHDFGALKDGKPTGTAQVIYPQSGVQGGQAVQSVLQSGYFSAINAKFVTVQAPFSAKSVPINEKSLSSFDYAFAGILGFTILGSGIFGPINIFPELKKMGILRRLHTTPLRVWQYFLSVMLGNAVVGMMSLALMYAVAIKLFNLHIAGNIFELVFFLIFSLILILGIGLAIGGWAKNERQAAPLANLIVFPMMFLSGTFFPRFGLPVWLQHVTDFFPLTPVIDGARLITTEGLHLTQIGPQLGIMAGWLVIVYAVAFRVFRWE